MSSLSSCAVATQEVQEEERRDTDDGYAFGDAGEMGGASFVHGSGGNSLGETSSGGSQHTTGGSINGSGGRPPVASCDVTITYATTASEVLLTGTLTTPAWAETSANGAIVMTQNGAVFEAKVSVSEGKHQFKFIADGNWEVDENAPTVTEDFNTNNVLTCVP